MGFFGSSKKKSGTLAARANRAEKRLQKAQKKANDKKRIADANSKLATLRAKGY